ncbi:DUF397 domain-containing protein [Streptomyces sp. NPDC051214]|uniref:DUF397 domain-containing protein n=1 Tax=Streptomyces sp. NPDC051214 TaxID=3155282 RepID=UPI0034122405
MSELRWQKSTFSEAAGPNCVYVAATREPAAPVLAGAEVPAREPVAEATGRITARHPGPRCRSGRP